MKFALSSPLCLVCVTLLLAGSPQKTSGQTTTTDSRVGQKIIVTTAGAELKTPEATVWRAYPGEVYDVTLVNGEWLWIQQKGGWMWEKDGVFFDKAIAVTSDRLAKNPTAEAYHVRGVVFIAHRQYDRALADFTSSLEKSPQNAGVLNNRGQCHYSLENYEAAIRDFDAAVKIEPKHFVALNNRALAHIALEQYSKARNDIAAALRLHPDYPEALLNRGVVHEKTGKSADAVKDYTAAIKVDPKYAAAYGNRAFSRRTLGRYTEAIADLRKAIELSPGNYQLVNDLAFTLATAKDDSVRNGPEAVALAEQAISMAAEEHWNTLDTLAVARAAVGDYDAAVEAVDKALSLAPDKEQTTLKAHRALIAAKMPILE